MSRAELLQAPLVRANIQALEAGRHNLAINWLKQAPFLTEVKLIPTEKGPYVLVVNGQSQASRRDPAGEAADWLKKQPAVDLTQKPGPLVLYGLGNPYLVPVISVEFPGRPLWIFEPDPAVALNALRAIDLSPLINGPEGPVRLLTPWHLVEKDRPGAATLLVHPASQRRQPTFLYSIKKFLYSSRPDLSGLAGRKPRLLIVPPLSGGSRPIAHCLARAAGNEGHEFIFLEWDREIRLMEAEARGRPPKEASALIARMFQRTAQEAAEAAGNFQPDLIISLAQAPLDWAALEKIRQVSSALLAFWLVEDYRFFNYVTELLPAYDAVFHIQEGFIEPFLRNLGLAESYYMPLAADPEIFRPDWPPVAALAAEVSFMGAGYPNRRALLSQLARDYWPGTGRPKENFKIFGSGWNGAEFVLNKHLFENGRRVSLAECARIYSQSRVNLNLHSSLSPEPAFAPESRFANPRTFEIAASGALQIVDPRPLMPPLFQSGIELVTAENPKDLPELIDYYLAHPQEARTIGQAARERVLAEHTYGHRLKQMLSCLNWES